MNFNKKIENIIRESMKSVLKENLNEYSYEELCNKVDSILNNIAEKNGWFYEYDKKDGRYIELGGSQVYFFFDDDGRIYVSDIRISGMSDAESSRNDCGDLIKLLSIVNNSDLRAFK